MTSILLAVVVSSISILSVDDAECAKAPKGWVRGVVRVEEAGALVVAPNETVAVLRRKRVLPDGSRSDDGIAGHASVDGNGTFAITVKPASRGRLPELAVGVQMNWTIQSEFLTFDPSLLQGGACLVIDLRKRQSSD